MAIIAVTKIQALTIHTLTGGQDLEVGADVVLQSFTSDAVVGNGAGSHTITVRGTITGEFGAIALGNAGADHVVRILSGAILGSASGDVVSCDSPGLRLINAGTIEGYIGVSTSVAGTGVARITNSGTIIAEIRAISIGADERSVLKNSGSIAAGNFESFMGGTSRDVVINTGLMSGDIDLRSGNDLYDGRGGVHIGVINGGGGDDTFRPGAAVEFINGGTEFDTVDFRSGGRVWMDLQMPNTNTGRALGDGYFMVERFFGSATAGDGLLGAAQADDLRGLGGNDFIIGRDGADSLRGGAGRDTLNGGFGDDVFFFESFANGRDVIEDFSDTLGSNDRIDIRQVGFGGGLELGALQARRLNVGADNLANDRSDRFILRTGDMTLWFDQDGSRTGFAPVMIANLQDTATLNVASIFVY
jgi:Ca2+-binding RTX toxin-like protein